MSTVLYTPKLGSARHRRLEVALYKAEARWHRWRDEAFSLPSNVTPSRQRHVWDRERAAWHACVDAGNKLEAYLEGRLR
jgi:hypothetical protein